MHNPSELVMFGGAVGLEAAGIPLTVFNPAAPLAACRLCGAVYQTTLHRELFNYRKLNPGQPDPPDLLSKVLELGTNWRETHTKNNHSASEVVNFAKTGFAFTPEAAKVLSPFGIIPLGLAHQDIADAMYEADRAPDLDKLESR